MEIARVLEFNNFLTMSFSWGIGNRMLSGLVKLKFISKSIEHTKYMPKVTLSVCPSVSNGIAKYDFSVAIQGIKIGG